ncbi:MAG: CotH kinase family protein, partial [Bacteroidota bacterium]
LYTSPLLRTTATVLSSRSFETNKAPSAVVTRTYFIDIGSTLPVIAISTPPPLLWDPVIGIYDHNFKSREIPIHFEFYGDDRRLGVELDASLSLTGQASLLYPQKSFTIGADDRFGEDVIEHQVFPERKLNLFSSLYLRNAGVPDHRSTYFRDALLHSLLLNKVDIDCQAYRPAAVFLNTQYWGIYNIRDKIDRFYIGSLHNLNPEDVDLIEYEADITPTVMEGNADNYQEFFAYVSQNDLSQEAPYRTVESWMDIDEYIHYMIAGIYDDNVFWMDENLRLWRERKPGARWRWILHDTDFGFGMPNWRSTGVAHNTLRFATSSNTGEPFVPPLWSTVLFRKLLLNQEFKTKFIQQFASFLNFVFHPDTVVGVIDRFQGRLSSEMPRHINRWKDGAPYYGDPIPDVATWLANVDVLRTFARLRPGYQRQHIIQYFQLSGTGVLAMSLDSAGMGRVRVNGIEEMSKSTSGIHFKGIPTILTAVPEVGFRFVRWDGASSSTANPLTVTITSDTLRLTAVFEAVAVDSLPARISRDTTLTRDHSPYHARTNVVVDSGVTLRFTEGVQIRMSEGTSLVVHGRLLVEGTELDPVVIAPREYATTWGALCFVNATDSSVLTFVKITGATKGPDFVRDPAAISGYNSRIGLQHVTIEDVQMPLFARYGSVAVLHSRLRTTYAGDVMNVKSMSVAITEDSELSGGEGFDSDAIDYDGVQEGVIRNNRIYGIYGFNSDAIDLGEGSQDILVEYNHIFNINDKGVSVGQGSTTLIRRNIIANCGMGVAVKDFDSHAQIEQNTFYANRIAVACYEKNLGNGGGQADVVNSILANSVESAVLVDDLSRLAISYSLSNTDPLTGLHNQNGDPLFQNDFYLSLGSPAIDNGSPLLPMDPNGSLPDLGAFPFDLQKQTTLIIDEIHYHPLEGADHEFTEVVNAGSVSVNLSGYRLEGSIQLQFGDVTLAPGEYVVLAKNSALYEGNGYRVFQWTNGALADTAGSLLVYESGGRLVDAVYYHSQGTWPREPNGLGPSLELHRTNLENLVTTSWSVSYSTGGSPGRSRGSTILSGLFLNEFMADNAAGITDEAGEYDDWIEIYNSNAVPVNMGGLYVTDNLSDPGKYMMPTGDASATTIPAKGFLILWADGQTGQGPRHVNIKLDKTGEQIGLAQAAESGFHYLDSLTFAIQETNRSFGRTGDGSTTWASFISATPGTSNGPASGAEDELIPMTTGLEQNYPNPFNGETVIRYQVAGNGEKESGNGYRASGSMAVSEATNTQYQVTNTRHISLRIYDLLGREVAVLVVEEEPAGEHEAVFSSQKSDFRLTSGVYFYRLTVGSFVETKKMVLLR